MRCVFVTPDRRLRFLAYEALKTLLQPSKSELHRCLQQCREFRLITLFITQRHSFSTSAGRKYRLLNIIRSFLSVAHHCTTVFCDELTFFWNNHDNNNNIHYDRFFMGIDDNRKSQRKNGTNVSVWHRTETHSTCALCKSYEDSPCILHTIVTWCDSTPATIIVLDRLSLLIVLYRCKSIRQGFFSFPFFVFV